MGKEIERLGLSLLLLGMLLGVFLITQLTGLIKTTLETFLLSSGFQISFSSFLLAISFIFFFRKKISQLTEARFSEKISHQGGAITGFLRGFVIIFIVTTLLSHIPFGLFNNSIHNSVIANQINFFIPIDEEASITRVEPPIIQEEPEELIIGY